MIPISSLVNQIFRRSLQSRIKKTVKLSLTRTMSSTDTLNVVPGESSQLDKDKVLLEDGEVSKHGPSEDFVDSEKKKHKPNPENARAAETSEQTSQRQRRKVAVLMAYSGQGYSGMQRNTGVKTIEDEFLSALLKANIISEENYNTPQSMQFQRAARTDKGVSAARQVVSLRIVVEDGLVEKINAHLPSQIQVFNVTRATKGFNSKLWCDARTYSYTLPTFAFAPLTEITSEEYRVSEDIIPKVNEILTLFTGTHNFHNFTSGRKPGDASAQRYIMEFECGQPFIEQDLEMVTIKVKGQSFMLHQIRKMIGLMIAIIRNLTSPKIIEKTWAKDKIDMPIAPGVGLVLEEVHYEKYNKRYGNDGLHDALDWTNLNETVEDFKRRYIHPTIINCEKTEKSMLQWLATLPLHTYDVREAGPHQTQTRSELGRAFVALELLKKNGGKIPESTKNDGGEEPASIENDCVVPIETAIEPIHSTTSVEIDQGSRQSEIKS